MMMVDFARVIAMVFMIQDHTMDALLSPSYLHGPAFQVWLFIRGLTAPIFLTLSGISFTLATISRWDLHSHPTAAVFTRARRYLFFILLGYAMHLPVRSLHAMRALDTAGWRSWLQVDVLQCIGITLIILQLVVLAARTPERYGRCTAILGAAIVMFAPVIWSLNWVQYVPVTLGSYLNSQTGSLFPIFPWSGYILFGAALGYLYAKRGSNTSEHMWTRRLSFAGVLMIVLGVGMSKIPLNIYQYPESYTPSPNLFMVRAGCVCLVLALMTYVTHWINTPRRLTTALARESLTVYFVHICVLYGSIWNPGLRQIIGQRLTLWECLAPVIVLVGSMFFLAWTWNWCKRTLPRGTALIRSTAIILVVGYLLT